MDKSLRARIVTVPFWRLISLAFLLTPVAAPQSVYTLEAIAADQFQPSIGFDEISGLQIDAHGNVAGLARKKGGRSVGFYWPTADSVKPLMLENAEGRFDCEPIGIDGSGSVHLRCEGERGAIFSAPLAALGSTEGSLTKATNRADTPPSNDNGLVLGKIAPSILVSPCAALAIHDPYVTFSTVTRRGANGTVTETLPLVAGDLTVTAMLARSVAPSGDLIVGVRDGVECVQGSSVTGRRAILWTRDAGKWTASVLDQIPISLEVGLCAHHLRLEEANDVNDAGQITGKGTCADLDGDVRAIAYRLTPVSIRQP